MPDSLLTGIAFVFAVAIGASGCSSSVGTQLPAWAGGLPTEAPAPAAVQPSYPDVYDTPGPRPTRLMSESEQTKTEAELAAVRAQLNAQATSQEKQKTARDR